MKNLEFLTGGGKNWTSPEISTLNINAEANFMTSGFVDKTAEYENDDTYLNDNSIWK